MQYPAAFTKPLSPDFPSDGPKLIRLVEKYYRTQDNKRLVLDEWQRWLLTAILERYPEGHARAGQLRYRQVVISMGRQNGKSLLAAILSLYGLFQQSKSPTIIGVASNREQAGIIYDRTYYVIKNNQALNQRVKPSSTRGLRFRDGSGSYEIRASKTEALQGLPITLGLVDELHILDEGVWDSLVNGSRAQKNGLVIGITTAGDDNSKLLKRLYKQGTEAIDGQAERFGFFLWEAPEGSTVHTPGAIEQANPAIACGRIELETTIGDVKSLPEVDQQRYTLNRFVASFSSWMPFNLWADCPPADINTAQHKVYSVDRSPDWSYASVSVHQKHPDGSIHSELAASIVKPTQERLEAMCAQLRKLGKCSFVMERSQLGKLADTLKGKGYDVHVMTGTDVLQACETSYAIIATQRLAHDAQPVLTEQVRRAQRKNVGERWRLIPANRDSQIDAIESFINGIYIAETTKPKEMQLFV